MRKHQYVRPIRPNEADNFLEWSRTNEANGFDPDVAKYPSTITWCVFDRFGPLAYMPMQHPIMLESLASRPGATKAEIATALKELFQQAVTQAHIRGVGEIYFLGTDDGTNEMANNHTFEKLPYTVYRCKVKDLECT